MEKTLAKGLIVLEALIQRREPCGVSDLAVALGMSKSNTHRLLNTLAETGYVQSVDGRYAASLKVWELGTQVIKGFDVRDLARPAMVRLVRETSESVRLTVLDPKSFEVVYIDKLDSPQDVRTFSEIGGRAPAHCTSSGKVLLAYQDEAFVRRMLRKVKGYTPKTITDPDVLMRELRKVRADGYALNNREFSPQVSGVAAPVFDGERNVIAALSVVAPAERMPPAVLKKVIAVLCDGAAGVSARMQPPPDTAVMADGMSRLRLRARKLARS